MWIFVRSSVLILELGRNICEINNGDLELVPLDSCAKLEEIASRCSWDITFTGWTYRQTSRKHNAFAFRDFRTFWILCGYFSLNWLSTPSRQQCDNIFNFYYIMIIVHNMMHIHAGCLSRPELIACRFLSFTVGGLGVFVFCHTPLSRLCQSQLVSRQTGQRPALGQRVNSSRD